MGPLRRWLWLALCAGLFSFAHVPDEDDLLLGRIRANRRQGQHRLLSGQDADSDTALLKNSGDAARDLLPALTAGFALPPPSSCAALRAFPPAPGALDAATALCRGRAPPRR